VKTILSDFLICQKILLFAYNNKKSAICIRKQDVIPSGENFIINLEDNFISRLESEVNESIERIFKKKENLKRNSFSIFSLNRIKENVSKPK